jgi:NitT/TauT family transport system substrate-binding protein
MNRAQLLRLPLAAALLGDAPAPTPLRVASTANEEVTPVLYAQQAGLFRAAGLDVDLQVIGNGAAITAAVVGGSIDIGRASLFGVITAHARGVPLVLVAPNAVAESTHTSGGMIVLADSPIHTARDLNGKIGSAAALNDIMVVSVKTWVDKHGGDSKSMQFVELTGPAVSAALDAGRIDVAAVVNPLLTQLLSSPKYRTLGSATDAISPHFLAAAFIATADYVQKNPATVKAFAGAIGKASAYCNDHPQQTAQLLADFSKIDLATIGRMDRSRYDVTLDPRDIQPEIDAAAKYNVISHGFDAREIIANV